MFKEHDHSLPKNAESNLRIIDSDLAYSLIEKINLIKYLDINDNSQNNLSGTSKENSELIGKSNEIINQLSGLLNIAYDTLTRENSNITEQDIIKQSIILAVDAAEDAENNGNTAMAAMMLEPLIALEAITYKGYTAVNYHRDFVRQVVSKNLLNPLLIALNNTRGLVVQYENYGTIIEPISKVVSSSSNLIRLINQEQNLDMMNADDFAQGRTISIADYAALIKLYKATHNTNRLQKALAELIDMFSTVPLDDSKSIALVLETLQDTDRDLYEKFCENLRLKLLNDKSENIKATIVALAELKKFEIIEKLITAGKSQDYRQLVTDASILKVIRNLEIQKTADFKKIMVEKGMPDDDVTFGTLLRTKDPESALAINSNFDWSSRHDFNYLFGSHNKEQDHTDNLWLVALFCEYNVNQKWQKHFYELLNNINIDRDNNAQYFSKLISLLSNLKLLEKTPESIICNFPCQKDKIFDIEYLQCFDTLLKDLHIQLLPGIQSHLYVARILEAKEKDKTVFCESSKKALELLSNYFGGFLPTYLTNYYVYRKEDSTVDANNLINYFKLLKISKTSDIKEAFFYLIAEASSESINKLADLRQELGFEPDSFIKIVLPVISSYQNINEFISMLNLIKGELNTRQLMMADIVESEISVLNLFEIFKKKEDKDFDFELSLFIVKNNFLKHINYKALIIRQSGSSNSQSFSSEAQETANILIRYGIPADNAKKLSELWNSHKVFSEYLHKNEKRFDELTDIEIRNLSKELTDFYFEELKAFKSFLDLAGMEKVLFAMDVFGIVHFSRINPKDLLNQIDSWNNKNIEPTNIIFCATSDHNGAFDQIANGWRSLILDAEETVDGMFYFEVSSVKDIARITRRIGDRERSAGRIPNVHSSIKRVVIAGHGTSKSIQLGIKSFISYEELTKALDFQKLYGFKKRQYGMDLGNNYTLVLNSCSTAETKDSQENIAKILSKYHEIEVIGADSISYGIKSIKNGVVYNSGKLGDPNAVTYSEGIIN